MTKQETIDAAAIGQGCLGRSQDDEPVFVIVARDQLSSYAVRDWAQRFRSSRSQAGTFDDAALAKYRGAIAEADAMDRWRLVHGGGKLPD